MFTLVTGGLRSGQSVYALRRASEYGPPPWLYVAQHVDGDQELKARLAGLRRDHESTWRPIEAPARLDSVLEPETAGPYGGIVIDRFTAWVSSRLLALGDDATVLAEIEQLADRLYRSVTPAVLVTMETGLGIMPEGGPERRLTNVVGLANQILAERAHSVVLMVSGVSLRLR